jgi:hypothetical protein
MNHVLGRYSLSMEWIRLSTEIETDCAELDKALSNVDVRWSRWVGIISEIKETSRMLPLCKFMHVRREANQVAHDLAK